MSVSRRQFIASGAVAASVGILAGCESPRVQTGGDATPLAEAIVPFDGPVQAGVATPQQASLDLVGFRLKEGVDKRALARLMRLWTEDARAITAGDTPLGSLEPEMNQKPANLTITVGFGERVFDIAAPAKKPAWLHDMPPLSRDQLDPKWGQTDLVLQICSDDPLMNAWAMRHMTRAAMDYVSTQWVQQGFMNAFGSIKEGETPRNMFGQVDGTVNPHTDAEYAEQVWIDEPGDFAGSTSMVVRRIAMNLDTWEMLDRTSREEAVGRKLDDGAPLTGGDEHTPPDMNARDEYGLPVIDRNSHMARSMPPADHPEQQFKRRPYNYNLPPEPDQEQLSNAGLVFITFQKDPDVQFVPVLARLDEADRLNEWITHIGSAVYWVPPGTSLVGAQDRFWGESILS